MRIHEERPLTDEERKTVADNTMQAAMDALRKAMEATP